MTERQALTEARRRWGKRAAVRMDPRGAFIGDDLKWRESICAVSEDGKINDRKRREFYIKSRNPLVLGRIKYWVAAYTVGYLNTVVIPFFHVEGVGPSWKAALDAAVKTRPE